MYRDDEDAADEELCIAEELCTAEELRMVEELKTGMELELKNGEEELDLMAEEAGPGTELVFGIMPEELLYATPASEEGIASAEEYGITASEEETPVSAEDEFMSAEIPDGVPVSLPQEIMPARRKMAPVPLKRKEEYPIKHSGNSLKHP